MDSYNVEDFIDNYQSGANASCIISLVLFVITILAFLLAIYIGFAQ